MQSVRCDEDEKLVPLLSCLWSLPADSSSSSVLVSLSSGSELHWASCKMASASLSCTDLACVWREKETETGYM